MTTTDDTNCFTEEDGDCTSTQPCMHWPVWTVAVIGSRSYTNYEELSQHLDEIVKMSAANGYRVAIISGGARGADSLGERYAEDHGLQITVLKPDYKTYGKAAPFVRNKDIINGSDEVIAFWDGESKGTKHATDYAESEGKAVSFVKFTPEPPKSFFDR